MQFIKTTDENYRLAVLEVQQMVALSHTSFGAGMAILPRPRREAMHALYAFCRQVDDIADDDGIAPEARMAALATWKQRIHALFACGQVETGDPITTVLLPAISAFALVEQDFQDIIAGMEMDIAVPICAPDQAMLGLYCDRVAGAVGRASVRIFGDDSESAMQVAYHLGRALQLTNILRDLAEDAERGRLYLPQNLLHKYGIIDNDPTLVLKDTALPCVCQELATVAHGHFNAASQAMQKCRTSAMRPARMMGAYYNALLHKLEQAAWVDNSQRVRLSKWEKIKTILGALISNQIFAKEHD